MEDLRENVMWALEYYGVNDKVKEIKARLAELQDGGVRKFVADTERKIKDYLQLNRTRVTVWDTENWEAQAELYIPFEARDLETLGSIPVTINDYVGQMQNQISNYGEQVDDWAMWDTINSYKPKPMSAGDIVPPFPVHATMAGSQHFMTFDRRFFEFDGECSYVLARDNTDGLFSVIVNYDRSRHERSIFVQVDGHRIEVAQEYKVFIDGTRREMPVEMG